MNGLLGLVLALMQALQFTAPTTRSLQWASPMQREAFLYGPQPECLSGGWGSGKTWDVCLKALWLSTEYPRNRGVIARHVGKELRETTMATFFKVCPPSLYDRSIGGRRNDQNGYLKLGKSQSEVLFIHLEDPDAAGILRGLEINWFVIDQAEENPDHMEELFDLLLGRLSRWDVAEVPQWRRDRYERRFGRPWPFLHPEHGTAVPPPYAMLACNPDVETHWIYRRFHGESHEHQALYRSRGYRMFHMPSTSNRFLGETNLRFLMDHDDAFIKRNVEGLWGMSEGAIHHIDPRSMLTGSQELLEHLRRSCRLYRTLDHGDSSPTCCLWWAVDQDGNVFCYREYYLGGSIISRHRENIAMLSEFESYDNDLADPSIFHQLPTKKGGRFTVASEYAEVLEQPRETAIFWNPADNNELGTRNRINEYLRVDPLRIHPIDKSLGSPRVFFVKVSDTYPQGCYHVLRETRAARRVRVGTDLGKAIFSDERDPAIPDHAYDPFRYFIASRAPVPHLNVSADPSTFFGAQQRLAARHRRQMGLRR